MRQTGVWEKPSKQQQEGAAGNHARHDDVALSEQQTSQHLTLELLVFQFGVQKLVSGSGFKLAQGVLDREERGHRVSSLQGREGLGWKAGVNLSSQPSPVPQMIEQPEAGRSHSMLQRRRIGEEDVQ